MIGGDIAPIQKKTQKRIKIKRCSEEKHKNETYTIYSTYIKYYIYETYYCIEIQCFKIHKKPIGKDPKTLLNRSQTKNSAATNPKHPGKIPAAM